jgi:hypothetical protein
LKQDQVVNCTMLVVVCGCVWLCILEGALRQDPNQKVAEINVGLVHAAKGDHAMAMAVCKPLETKYPDYGTCRACIINRTLSANQIKHCDKIKYISKVK